MVLMVRRSAAGVVPGDVGRQPVAVVKRAVGGTDEPVALDPVESGQTGLDVLFGKRRRLGALVELARAAAGQPGQQELGQGLGDRRALLANPLRQLLELIDRSRPPSCGR
jgi:hypothetical protein